MGSITLVTINLPMARSLIDQFAAALPLAGH